MIDLTPATFCVDCTMIIANNDTSGLTDPEDHLAKMDEHLTSPAIIDAPDGRGFHADVCSGCGLASQTDQWFAGWVDTTPPMSREREAVARAALIVLLDTMLADALARTSDQ